ncbi:hypothetical protein Tco_0253001 [Tanacetum coccineum]
MLIPLLQSEYAKPTPQDFLKTCGTTLDLTVKTRKESALTERTLEVTPRILLSPQDNRALSRRSPDTSDRHLIELENQVQRLMEAYLAPTQPIQVNKITTSCEICSGPRDTQYCMYDPEKGPRNPSASRKRFCIPANADGDEFTKTLQSIPTTRKLSERESLREIIDLDHFYDT